MALVAGAKAIGADFQNLTTQKHQPGTDSGTTTSTSYTTTRTGGTSPVGVSFTAPPSGKVLVLWNIGVFNSGASYGLCTYQVRTGTTLGGGSSFVGGSDDAAVEHLGTGVEQAGMSGLVTGLTAGNSYNATLMYRVLAGTGTFFAPTIIIVPAIA